MSAPNKSGAEVWTQGIGPWRQNIPAHLERLNQKLLILPQKVPQDGQSSFILLQTSSHHKLTELPDSQWRCLQGYKRQNLKNSEVWPKGFKNQKTKNI